MMPHFKIVFTDLDGTLLTDDKQISKEDRTSLNRLGDYGVLRVAATGRNLSKVRDVVPESIPLDYVIFSSGAGIFDWKNNKLLDKRNLNEVQTRELKEFFIDNDFSFFVFEAVPDNQWMFYHSGTKGCDDFNSYLQTHNSHARKLNPSSFSMSASSQFLIIIPHVESIYASLKLRLEEQFDFIKIIRSTSQLDPNYIWVEIFLSDVSKGHGADMLCRINGIDPAESIGIGNDYNDIDLLEFTGASYVTANAPEILKERYLKTKANINSGVTAALKNHFIL